MDYSKIESGALEIIPLSTNIRDLLTHTKRFFEAAAQGKGLDLILEIDASLPSHLILDSVRFRQILTNLIGNAIKFTHDGHIKLSAYVEMKEQSERMSLIVVIEDTGIGFDPELTESLFSPFVQADSTLSRVYGGTGLGLSITRSLIQKMGGEITSRSSPGKGSVFRVKLPCQLPKNIVGDSNIEIPSTGSIDFKKLHILLAEDHPVNQKIMLLMLTKMGHQVSVVENGLQALDFLSKNTCDFLLLDAMMPIMDGLQMLEILREKEKRRAAHSWST